MLKKILHQQLGMVYCGGEGRNCFLSLLLRKQKHWHSQLKITFVEILHAKF